MPLFQRLYPEATRVLSKLPHTHQGTKCVPCILGKAPRSPISKTAELKPGSPKEPLNTIFTDTTRAIPLPDAQGNRYLQLFADAVTDLMRGKPVRRKRDAAKAMTQHIKNLSTWARSILWLTPPTPISLGSRESSAGTCTTWQNTIVLRSSRICDTFLGTHRRRADLPAGHGAHALLLMKIMSLPKLVRAHN